jgi:hypothetical protein
MSMSHPMPHGAARVETDMLPAASLAAVPIRAPRSRFVPPPSLKPEPDGAPRNGDPAAIAAWWGALKRGRDFPSPDDIDTEALAAAWPEAVLLGYDQRQAEITRATRLGAGKSDAKSGIEYSPMVTEWLLALGRKAARMGTVLCETKDFPVAQGTQAYRIVSLPLRAGRSGVDQVLCHVGRA